MYIRSLRLRLGRPYTEYEVHQIIQSQVQHDLTDDDIPEVKCGVWLKYLPPVTQKGGFHLTPRTPPGYGGMPMNIKIIMYCSCVNNIVKNLSFLCNKYFYSTLDIFTMISLGTRPVK